MNRSAILHYKKVLEKLGEGGDLPRTQAEVRYQI